MGNRESFTRRNWLGLLASAGFAAEDAAGSVRSRLPKDVPCGLAAISARTVAMPWIPDFILGTANEMTPAAEG